MSHNHNHCCEHKSVEYCKVCRVVHCLNCKQEWGRYTSNYNWDWYYKPIYTTGGLQWGTNTAQLNDEHQQVTLTTTADPCSHGN